MSAKEHRHAREGTPMNAVDARLEKRGAGYDRGSWIGVVAVAGYHWFLLNRGPYAW